MIPRRAVWPLLLGLSLGLCAHAQKHRLHGWRDVLGRKTFTIGGGMG